MQDKKKNPAAVESDKYTRSIDRADDIALDGTTPIYTGKTFRASILKKKKAMPGLDNVEEVQEDLTILFLVRSFYR